MKRVQTAEGVVELVGLLGRFFKEGSRDVYHYLKNTPFNNDTVEKFRIIIIAYLEHVAEVYREKSETFPESAVITYKELAVKANKVAEKLNSKIRIPLRGDYFRKVIGQALGILSTVSYLLYNTLISNIIVAEDTRKPGEGFDNLAKILDVNLENDRLQLNDNKLKDALKKIAQMVNKASS